MPDFEPQDLNINRAFSKEDVTWLQKLLDWVIKSGKKIIIVTEAFVLLSLFVKFNLTRNVNAVNYRIEDLKIEIMDGKAKEDEFNKVVADIQKIKQVEASTVNWDFMIEKIKSSVPEDMLLNSTFYKKGQVEIKSEVKSVEGFAFFINKLINDPDVKNVFLTNSEFDKETELYSIQVLVEFLK